LRQPGYFQFKQFGILQSQEVFRVGSDSVLLGAWVSLGAADSVLDVGTGSGLLALMSAQKVSQTIWAIDSNEHAVNLARTNASASPWKHRIEVHQANLEDWKGPPVNHVVCNPPYFLGLASKVVGRFPEARHADNGLPERWAACFARLVSPTGNVSMVLPCESAEIWSEALKKHHFHLVQQLFVSSFQGDAPVRVLSTWKQWNTPLESIAVDAAWMYEPAYPQRSAWYRRLCEEYYL